MRHEGLSCCENMELKKALIIRERQGREFPENVCDVGKLISLEKSPFSVNMGWFSFDKTYEIYVCVCVCARARARVRACVRVGVGVYVMMMMMMMMINASICILSAVGSYEMTRHELLL